MPTAPKLPSLPNLFSLITPAQLDEARKALETFIATRTRQFTQRDWEELAKELNLLLTRFGTPVEKALYATLCDRGEIRRLVDEAMGESVRAAVSLIVPLLVAQFALTPSIALLVASFIIKTLASKAQDRLCQELSKRRQENVFGSAKS